MRNVNDRSLRRQVEKWLAPGSATSVHVTEFGRTRLGRQRYAIPLLDAVMLMAPPERFYDEPLAEPERGYELPFQLKLALATCAADRAPLPARLALAWVKRAPGVPFRTAATRCKDEFDKLFVIRYAEAFGAGIVLPKNRTRLKMQYTFASSGFRSGRTVEPLQRELQDVTVLNKTVQQLAEVVEATTADLEPFSRFLARSPEARDSLAALLLLPAAAWPDSAQTALRALMSRVGDSMSSLTFGYLQSTLGAKDTLSRAQAMNLSRVLAAHGIGIEPDLSGGARQPRPEDPVVLFALDDADGQASASQDYQVARLTLQFAAAVAAADGELAPGALAHLDKRISTWEQLTVADRKRLPGLLALWLCTSSSKKDTDHVSENGSSRTGATRHRRRGATR